MHDFTMTVADMFSNEALADAQRLGSKEQRTSLKEALERETDAVEWQAVEGRIAEEIARFLRLPLKGILLKAWEKEQGIEAILDASRDTPEETTLLPLAEHTVHSEHHPRITFFVNGRPIRTIVIDIAVQLDLEGCLLSIRNGRVLQTDVGSCKAGATVACGGVTLLERESETIEVPGAIHFDEEI